MRGIDYGWGKVPGAAIKYAGFDFVCRYLSHSPGKNISAAELADLQANDLKIVLVWETTERRCLDGFDAGKEDANAATAQIQALGVNPQCLYFACDDDFSEDDLDDIKDYFKGVNDVIGAAAAGVYGGIVAVKGIMDAGLATYGWQTFAWSHHQWHPAAQLRQIQNGVPTLHGVQCDTDESVADDFGQF